MTHPYTSPLAVINKRIPPFALFQNCITVSLSQYKTFRTKQSNHLAAVFIFYSVPRLRLINRGLSYSVLTDLNTSVLRKINCGQTQTLSSLKTFNETEYAKLGMDKFKSVWLNFLFMSVKISSLIYLPRMEVTAVAPFCNRHEFYLFLSCFF